MGDKENSKFMILVLSMMTLVHKNALTDLTCGLERCVGDGLNVVADRSHSDRVVTTRLRKTLLALFLLL